MLPAPLIPHVIPQSDRVDALFQQRAGDRSGDPGASGGIFSIGYNEVQIVLLTQSSDPSCYFIPTGTADYITNKKYTNHDRSLILIDNKPISKVPARASRGDYPKACFVMSLHN